MGKKKNSSSSSNESFGSAHSSLTVVPSKGSTRSSVTIKGNSDESFHSLEKRTTYLQKQLLNMVLSQIQLKELVEMALLPN